MSKIDKYIKNKIIHGNCIDILKNIESNSVDVVFADPPYNLQLQNPLNRPNNTSVDGVNDTWDKFDSFEKYDSFNHAWLYESRRVLKDTGTLWVIGSYHNVFRLGYILQNLGFWILNDIIWQKTNPMPNFRGKRFTNAHETLIWCSKDKNQKKYTFNYNAMKTLNDDLQMRSDWNIPLCRGNERIKVDGKKAHPTQKPEALLSRVILSSTKQEDLILDPFSGTGTTAAVAKKLNRNFIAIEKDLEYVKISRKRLIEIKSHDAEILNITPSKRTLPRIPFGSIVEQGLLKPGSIVFDFRRKYYAKVRADGSLISTKSSESIEGSIHKVGASLQGAPACNGWTFWHYETKNGPISIDTLRQKIRSETS